MPKRALLVVDMDHANGWAPDSVKMRSTSAQVAQSLCKRLCEWRQEKCGMVVFVMFPGTTKEMQTTFAGHDMQTALFEHSTTRCIACDAPSDKRLASFLEHQHMPFEPVFIKYSLDAFRNKQLAPFLRSRGVEEVVLAGCLTEECVECTAGGALKENFNITLLGDCVDYPIISDESKKEWVRWIRAVERPAAHLSVRVE